MKRTLLFALAILLTLGTSLHAAEITHRHPLAYNGFSGGMMLHTGYVSRGHIAVGAAPAQHIAGMPVGIGGALKVRFGNHLRIGTEGYASSLSYGDWGSSVSIGWGGLLADWCFPLGRFTPYVGATIGGGVVENLTLTSTPPLDLLPEADTSYRTYGVGLIVPFAGVDYALTSRIALTFKADYMFTLGSPEFDTPTGVRCYVGFMFSH